ncbi:MAG TPA: putative transporter small subunit [Actinomycetaceae bacterium]|nr:putative transporter small subunit [Actinomycetaceae bacterium]
MSVSILTVYVLMWPVIVAGVLAYIVRGFIGDVREARDAGEDVI